jgi:predicted metal-dependent HD superfamily phosphohydrolase
MDLPEPTTADYLRFVCCADRLGVDSEEAELRWADLTTRYKEPHRFYHTWGHIQHSLDELNRVEAEGLVRDPYLLEWAIFHHDAIYSIKWSKANEDLSARMAMIGTTIKIADREKIERLILFTDPTMPPAKYRDEQLMQDIDRTILGSDREVYEYYASHIRMEYLWVDHKVFNEGRIAILQSFLDKDDIYLVDFFKKRYEERARWNLQREINSLRKELA